MLWFWGTLAAVLAVLFVGAWFHDRRGRGSGMTEHERSASALRRSDAHRLGDSYGAGGG